MRELQDRRTLTRNGKIPYRKRHGITVRQGGPLKLSIFSPVQRRDERLGRCRKNYAISRSSYLPAASHPRMVPFSGRWCIFFLFHPRVFSVFRINLSNMCQRKKKWRFRGGLTLEARWSRPAVEIGTGGYVGSLVWPIIDLNLTVHILTQANRKIDYIEQL